MNENSYEYIVVGSGAGGGTLAARLAENGCKVLLLEAGGDPIHLKGGDPAYPNENRLPDDYNVPVFHAFASENEAMSWNFFVRHYKDDAQQKRDPKFVEKYEGKSVEGILYPRAGTLGGCTAHNAMITVYPHNQDWDDLWKLTGDSSWKAENMRKYFERLEDCHHRFGIYRWLAKMGLNPTRHGWEGWLQTEKAVPKEALGDKDLVQVIAESAVEAIKKIGDPLEKTAWNVQSQLDPNDWRLVKDNAVGLRYPPLATRNHTRIGSRDRVLEVMQKYPDRLKIELNALVTQIIFDEQNKAVGVKYLKGEKLYRAYRKPANSTGETKEVRVSREVILSGGAFNTPQLLMLSGIGPKKHLEEHGISVRVDLPGVGTNMQDRYEVGVVYRMKNDWKVLKGAKFHPGDPQFTQWQESRSGVYTTNGAVLAFIKRSDPKRSLPDLFCFALLGKFGGYVPSYSKDFAENHNYLTWAILKAHTANRGGVVRLRSADPRDTPYINFHYFDEGTANTAEEDVTAVVDGIEFIRAMGAQYGDLVAEEELPGKKLKTRDELKQFVKDHAWGHHASCTCPMGDRKNNGVVDGNFRVHGTQNLRIVDASIFPKIPGFFIVSSVYMIGEKAADVILQDKKA